MLYLMMNKCDNQFLVKVGYSDGTKNLKTRRKAYYSYNPTAIMRSSCAGSRGAESVCRTLLVEMGGIRITGTEWFSVAPLVYNKLYNEGLKVLRPKQNPIHFIEEF